MSERTLTFDELVDALASIGDGPEGCQFEPLNSDDPDHHGKEFAEALWESIENDRRIIAEMLRNVKP